MRVGAPPPYILPGGHWENGLLNRLTKTKYRNLQCIQRSKNIIDP